MLNKEIQSNIRELMLSGQKSPSKSPKARQRSTPRKKNFSTQVVTKKNVFSDFMKEEEEKADMKKIDEKLTASFKIEPV